MSAGDLNSPLVFVLFIFISLYSEKSQEISKNLNKALEKHLERDSLLETVKVFSQDLSICCKICTALVLKLDIDFTTFEMIPCRTPRCHYRKHLWTLFILGKNKSAYIQKWQEYKPCIKTEQMRAKIFKKYK